MLTVKDLELDPNQRIALTELDDVLCKQFPIRGMILFGSVARGDADEESDMDVLIITEDPIERKQQRRISSIVLEINLKYDANISAIVVDKRNWTSGPISVVPFHHNVVREGIKIGNGPDGLKFIAVSNEQCHPAKHHRSRQLKNSTQIDSVVNYWWKNAEDCSNSAKRELESGALTFAVNRLYYSLFYAVSAMLLSRGYDRFTKHTGVRAVFNRDFVRTGVVDQEMGALYNKLFEDRQKGDYEAFTDFSNEDVVDWFERSKIFLEQLHSLVKFPNQKGER